MEKQKRHYCYSTQCQYIKRDNTQCTRNCYGDYCFAHKKSKKALKPCLNPNCNRLTASKFGYCQCSTKIIKNISQNKIYEKKKVDNYYKKAQNDILGTYMLNLLK